MAETNGHTHQLLIFEHKHKITNSKFEKKQAPREKERVMDLKRKKINKDTNTNKASNGSGKNKEKEV